MQNLPGIERMQPHNAPLILVELAGFSKISFDTAIFPKSCSNAALCSVHPNAAVSKCNFSPTATDLRNVFRMRKRKR